MGRLTFTCIFYFQLLLLVSLASSAILCSHDQSSALLQFKQLFSFINSSSLNCDYYSRYPFRESPPHCDGRCPPHSKTLSWKENIDCCSWDGVTCDPLTGHVIGLDLSCSWLQGNIPSNTTLFLFSQLQTLNLAFNNFSNSPISSYYFRRFPSLTHLNLSNSNFSGHIPSEISHLSKLVSLDLSSHFEHTSIFPGRCYESSMILETSVLKGLVQNLTRLRELFLDCVNMSTILPNSFNNLSSSLTSVSLNGCGLQGKIPDRIFHLPNLRILSLAAQSNLTGTLPKANWSTPLKFLDVSGMNLSGELPNSIGKLVSLKYLDLHACTLYGLVPAALGNLTQLTFLSLWLNNFTGHIPSFLSNFRHLHHLILTRNNFNGEIPDIFVNLTQLSNLYLAANQLVGQLPSGISGLQNLVAISLSYNSLTGPLPSWLFTLPSLKFVFLNNNNLTWPIDDFQSNSLQEIHLGNNWLHGSIPSSIFDLVNLTLLDLSSNSLSVTLEPYMFAKLKNLGELILSNNTQISVSTRFKVDSSFPKLWSLGLSSCKLNEFPEFLRSLEQLEQLDLSDNPQISMSSTFKVDSSFPKLQKVSLFSCNLNEFPELLRNGNQLEYLDLSDNKIQGRIPNWMWDIGKDTLYWLNLSHNSLTDIAHLPWKNLEYLDLHSNLLEGPLPIPPPDLILFLLSNNNFTGEIPLLICSMTTMEILDLSNNNLSGTIPECMGNLSSLHVLDLQKNKFYGTIPGMFAKGNRLRTLKLNDNGLGGPVSRSLVNCTKLEDLNLGNNKINDTFPYWLGSLPKLHVLVLHSNQFYGSIWNSFGASNLFPNLRIFDLSNNFFCGPLPIKYFQNLNAMMNIDDTDKVPHYIGESESYYHDSVIVTLKGFRVEFLKIITIFTAIDFSNNRLSGKIPEIVGKLHVLKLLNLSHNSLVGCIPSELENLQALETLDLSSNKLVGKIPWQLTRLNFLQVINLSNNHLVGLIPQDIHFGTFPNTSFEGNLGLYGFPLSNQCITNETSKSPLLLEDDAGFLDVFGWKVVLMGYGCGIVFGAIIGYLVFSMGKPQWLIRIVEGQRRSGRGPNRNHRGRIC